jgi:hypothetical protein
LNNNPPNNQNQPTPEQPQSNNQVNQQPSALMQIVGAVLSSLIGHFTGQKISPNSNNTEMQLVLSQVLSIQQQILTNQQAFNQRLIALENSATQQFTNLINQVQSIKSIRLSHSKETKAIDYNLPLETEN